MAKHPAKSRKSPIGKPIFEQPKFEPAAAVAPLVPQAQTLAPVKQKSEEPVRVPATKLTNASKPEAQAHIEPPRHEEKAVEDRVAEQFSHSFGKVSQITETPYQMKDMGFSDLSRGLLEWNSKYFDALRANAARSLDFFTTLSKATSMNEAVRLQSEHLRKSYELMREQGQELNHAAKRLFMLKSSSAEIK